MGASIVSTPVGDGGGINNALKLSIIDKDPTFYCRTVNIKETHCQSILINYLQHALESEK